MSKTATIQWAPFSDKHKAYIKIISYQKISGGYTERPEGSLGNSAMFSRRDYSFSKALTSTEWKKYNNSIMTGVDEGLV